MTASAESRKFGVEWVTLDELWSQADYITLHTPLIAQTRRESRRLYTVYSPTPLTRIGTNSAAMGTRSRGILPGIPMRKSQYLTFVPLYTAEIRRNNGFCIFK